MANVAALLPRPGPPWTMDLGHLDWRACRIRHPNVETMKDAVNEQWPLHPRPPSPCAAFRPFGAYVGRRGWTF
ncbi:Hypothetical protein FKW44_022781 [Caligus rogercresseyi]|uniref:Uncharacterized protein n=1 Tax=Caligus rogercresseyi TaxID=217165 RepID=A0A7T8JUN5_CALRO|nr:Hypothetical protein FKW44_022781 [Caligus rogercresseyi]